jgi:hypothetical protein
MMIFNGMYFGPLKLSVLLIKVAKLGSSLVSFHVLSKSAYLATVPFCLSICLTVLSIRLSLFVDVALLGDEIQYFTVGNNDSNNFVVLGY